MKIRCSQLGAFLTRGRGKNDEFGLTALDVIRQVKIGNKYGDGLCLLTNTLLKAT